MAMAEPKRPIITPTRISASRMLPAMPAFRLSTRSVMGMRTVPLHAAMVSSVRPCPSLPMTTQIPPGQLDAAALRRIFDNILSNAVKYSDGDLAVSLLPDGSVTFSNSAQTLSRVQAERLFDRFYTVEAARNSTGLGLSIARLLVEKMNGTITADYKDGKLHICVCFPQQNEENT